jgi:indolepyruvate ferredoxin oxidoreductase alpha subunit
MNLDLLLGDEAIGLGAIDAGISGVYAYPGTPSTEIMEFVQQYKNFYHENIHASWSTNEKTAYETALGMSYAGKRALVCMKHVGLNVAADAFINSAITGVNGGLVLVSADDPSMHSSQNEQDSRFYGKFAMIPVIEPSNQQEAYEATRYAFDLSERVKLPVMIRITTRLAHSRSVVTRKNKIEQNPLHPEKNLKKFVLLPANARVNYNYLIDLQDKLQEFSENSQFNKIVEGLNDAKAIIAFGIAFNYVMEVIQQNKLDIPVLKISQYPIPAKKIKLFAEKYESILVAEEGYPIYEELLKGLFGNEKFNGRLDGTLPRTGELNPDIISNALSIKKKAYYEIPSIVKPRLPRLCDGCSHRDLFESLIKALEGYENIRVFSDIGCYTLGALPPFNIIHTCVDMGASITMAKGAADAGFRPAIAVIGDSTFTHSGITGLLDIVNDNSPVTIIISDNRTTAMTGGQKSPGTDKFVDICKGIGVNEKHIRKIEPLRKHLDLNASIIKEEIEFEGVSVIISERECIQTAVRRKRQQA